VVGIAGFDAEALASPRERAFEGSSSSRTEEAPPPTERRVSGV
jgi:hypothetical protein